MLKQKPVKNVLVAWSGGLDSTGLIYSLLKEGHVVQALPILMQCNEYKNEMETKAREELAKYFRAWFPSYFLLLSPTEVNSDSLFECLAFKQVIPWIYGLLANVTDENDEVSIGYVMSDSVVSYEQEIKAIWNSFNGITMPRTELPPLTFPLTKTYKREIIRSMPKELVDNVVWCETPYELHNKSRYCGICNPCKRVFNEDLLSELGVKAEPTVVPSTTMLETSPSSKKSARKHKQTGETK